MGAHYLRFDIQVMFRDTPVLFSGQGELAHVDEHGVEWRGSVNWPVIFAIGRWEKRILLLIDTWRFFQGGLARVCEDLNLPVQKMERPACILEGRAPREDEREYFLNYAMVDADAVKGLLTHIDSLWSGMDLGPCISLAHMAGRIFRKDFTRGPEGKPKGLDFSPGIIQTAGVAAYHGGRNSLRADSLPLVVEGCRMFDVRSLYPSICSNWLPSFFGGHWTIDRKPVKIEGAGLYRVSGTLRPGKGEAAHYRLLMNAKGEYLPHDQPFRVWVTGFELQTALQGDLIESPRYIGIRWVPGKEDKRHPFREFFQWVFTNKEANRKRNRLLYLYYKNLGNSLTGKFIASIPQVKDGMAFRVPGLLFNAPIAAAITGCGRARLYREEIRCSSIHAATDSMVVPPWGKTPLGVGPGMGEWEQETEGVFVAARNKLYAFLGKKEGDFTGKTDKGVFVYRGRPVLKSALHAFHGTIGQFLDAVFTGQKAYTYQRMTHLREAAKRKGITPLTMQQFSAVLDFGGKYSTERG